MEVHITGYPTDNIEYVTEFRVKGQTLAGSFLWQNTDIVGYRVVQPIPAPAPKRKVQLYQWLCCDGDRYWIVGPHSWKPDKAIQRLDETMIEVEVDG